MSATINISGISAFYHDSAAARVWDGESVAAAQEEWFEAEAASYQEKPEDRPDDSEREANLF